MRSIAIAFLLSSTVGTLVSAADWHQFRGPQGQGHADAHDLPTRWSETENVVWKVAIPGKGHSSPVVVNKQVWLTSAQENGLSLRTLCIDRTGGKIIHNVELFRLETSGPKNVKNSFASPTPIVEKDRVYVHFGQRGTACLSTFGDVIWKNTSLQYSQPYAGASTPILFEDFMILTCDGTDSQFVVALNKRTGKVEWKTIRTQIKRRGGN